jgi:hypothetical protein
VNDKLCKVFSLTLHLPDVQTLSHGLLVLVLSQAKEPNMFCCLPCAWTSLSYAGMPAAIAGTSHSISDNVPDLNSNLLRALQLTLVRHFHIISVQVLDNECSWFGKSSSCKHFTDMAICAAILAATDLFVSFVILTILGGRLQRIEQHRRWYAPSGHLGHRQDQ